MCRHRRIKDCKIHLQLRRSCTKHLKFNHFAADSVFYGKEKSLFAQAANTKSELHEVVKLLFQNIFSRSSTLTQSVNHTEKKKSKTHPQDHDIRIILFIENVYAFQNVSPNSEDFKFMLHDLSVYFVTRLL